MVVGLAGPMGAGKDQLIPVFLEMGFRVVHLDQWGHKALGVLKEDILKEFGPGILAQDNSVDRRALGSLVFTSPKAMEKLNSLVHPWMRHQIEDLIAGEPESNWVLNAAILSTLGMEPLCHHIVWVTASRLTRWMRIMSRDRLGPRVAWHRISGQRDLSPQQFTGKVDIVIRNRNGRLEESRTLLRRKLEQWVAR